MVPSLYLPVRNSEIVAMSNWEGQKNPIPCLECPRPLITNDSMNELLIYVHFLAAD